MSHVLPELGEELIHEMTFDELAAIQLAVQDVATLEPIENTLNAAFLVKI